MTDLLLHRDLLEDWLEKSLPGALLVSGPVGIGKAAFARALARRIVGAHEDAPAHPDILVASPNEELKTRPVDIAAIRDLTRALSLTSTGASRVALVLESDRMTVGAANALLKTLEEPAPGTHMLLTAAEPWRLPPTIRSRLAIRTLPTPDEDASLAFLNEHAPNLDDDAARRLLRIANNAPFMALEMGEQGSALALEVAKLASVAARGSFDRVAALSIANKAGDAGWDLLSRLILRFLHLAASAASGQRHGATCGVEQNAIDSFAGKAGPFKSAEAWRIVSELKRATEIQALAKPWSLYRMTLSFEWACR